MRYLFLFLCSVSFGQFNFDSPLRFLALGDSYTIGESVSYDNRWPTQLFDTLENLGADVDTLHYIATTGWTTTNLINAIQNSSFQNYYNLVSLLIGVNNEFQGRPFSLYESEFPQLISRALEYVQNDTNQLIVVSIPDYAYTPFGGGRTTISDRLDDYNTFAQDYCDSLGIAFYYITDISRRGLDETDLVAIDNLHPSGKQYGEWVDLIIKQYNESNVAGISSADQNEFDVYPNPVSDILTFRNPENLNFSLVDLNGNVILETIDQQMDLSKLPGGMYYLKQGTTVQKIIKN